MYSFIQVVRCRAHRSLVSTVDYYNLDFHWLIPNTKPTPLSSQSTQPAVLDKTAVDVATATKNFAGYASHNKHATLQTGVLAINSVVDVKIREVMSGQDLDQGPEEIIKIMGPLLSTTHDLTIRPVAYPSAILIMSTAHKLSMLLEMVEVPKHFEDTQREWTKAVKELSKGNAKWARLNALPGSLVRLLHTELDLTIMSIPDPKVSM